MSDVRHDHVGVRELRQNLSVYLRRVKAGETLVVTERNEPVAELVPLPSDDPYQRMVAEGKIRPGKGNFHDIEPLNIPVSNRSAQILDEMREDRI